MSDSKEEEFHIPRNVKTGHQVGGMDGTGWVLCIMAAGFLIPLFALIMTPVPAPYPVKYVVVMGISIGFPWVLFWQNKRTGDMNIQLGFNAFAWIASQFVSAHKGTIQYWRDDDAARRREKTVRIKTGD
ncbi:hypothetical protein [Salinithrix halophila]|uniref:TcpE family protein n=1 Tax=Salinithrix halophila TaxID=1485204 RepID=A0ABV8J8Q0_9BACL